MLENVLKGRGSISRCSQESRPAFCLLLVQYNDDFSHIFLGVFFIFFVPVFFFQTGVDILKRLNPYSISNKLFISSPVLKIYSIRDYGCSNRLFIIRVLGSARLQLPQQQPRHTSAATSSSPETVPLMFSKLIDVLLQHSHSTNGHK